MKPEYMFLSTVEPLARQKGLTTVFHTFTLDSDKFEAYIRAAGFSFSHFRLLENQIILSDLAHPHHKGMWDPELSFDLREDEARKWAENLPPHPNTYKTSKAWVKDVRKRAKKSKITFYCYTSLLVAVAKTHTHEVALPSLLIDFGKRATSALESVEAVMGQETAPAHTALVLSEIRIAREHLIKRLIELSSFPHNAVISFVESDHLLGEITDSICAKADEIVKLNNEAKHQAVEAKLFEFTSDCEDDQHILNLLQSEIKRELA